MDFHDYLYDYYDRNLSHSNMGYEYYAIDQGLRAEDVIPADDLAAGRIFPPSDEMMMDTIVPMFVDEDQFMVYCLTVSGHLNYTLEENIMSARHWTRSRTYRTATRSSAILPARSSWSWLWRAW